MMTKFFGFFKKHTKSTVWIFRILLGSLFIISGVAKLIDLWGFIYKIEQYLNLWDIPEPRSIVFMGALGISAFEFIGGALLITGSFKRTSVWGLLLLMTGMLPLSLYIAIANPIDDCGCFGDFIQISNTSTFLKNVFIVGGLIYLLLFNHKVNGLFHRYIQWIQVAIYVLYSIIISLIGYNVQPLFDFRNYKIGSNIISAGESSNISFIYAKDGHQEHFNIDNLPDSTWTFVDRIEEFNNGRGNSLVITDNNGYDITTDVISDYGEQLLLLIPEIDRADISYTYIINEINQYINSRGGNMIGLLSTNKHGVEYWKDISMADYELYTVEDTSIKEIARGNIALVYVIDGKIQWKRTLSSIDASLFIDQPKDDAFNALYINGQKQFMIITALHISALIILLIIDHFRLIVTHYLFRKNRKRM